MGNVAADSSLTVNGIPVDLVHWVRDFFPSHDYDTPHMHGPVLASIVGRDARLLHIDLNERVLVKRGDDLEFSAIVVGITVNS